MKHITKSSWGIRFIAPTLYFFTKFDSSKQTFPLIIEVRIK